VRGEVVVDLVGGWVDEARTAPWQPDTLVDVYSVGKAVLSTLALQQVDQGHISLDTPLVERARFGNRTIYELIWTPEIEERLERPESPPPPPA
jgi:CubicO group peptidase (beta-lactamase class C family)